jgi:hypothetical protein
MAQAGLKPGITQIHMYTVITRLVYLMTLNSTLGHPISSIPVLQCDAQNIKHWVKEMAYNDLLIQMSFKFLHSATTSSFGVRGLIRLGTSCMEDVSLVAVQ